jgi:hypothetical protein
VSGIPARRRTTLLRTAKSCGPDAATLASSLAEADRAQPGGDAPISAKRRWQKSPFAGESTNQAVKTIAQGEPDDAGKPVVTNSCVLFPTHEAAGVSDTRLSLRPTALEGQRSLHHPGAIVPRQRTRLPDRLLED